MLKKNPIGICDQCDGVIGYSKPGWYTSKHQPRRYCCRTCRNTANAIAGVPVRNAKCQERIEAGIWVNPAGELTHDQITANAKLVGAAAGAKFKEQVEAGTWRNPALSDKAKKKLSRPRTIKNKILHSAISKLTQGAKMADLSPEEREAQHKYRKAQRTALRASWAPERREQERAKWRSYKHKNRPAPDDGNGP